MLRIGICDDERVSIDSIRYIVDKYFSTNNKYSYSIEEFSDAINLMEYIRDHGRFDIIFLDVYMPLMLGTEVAKVLRKRGDSSRIIFLTTSKSHAIEAFSVRASDYILKPVKEDRVFAILDEIIPQIDERDGKTFPIKTSDGIVNLKCNEISHIELDERRVKVKLRDGSAVVSLVIRGSFEEKVEALLKEKNFVQCQKSYVVNMDQVQVMDSDHFEMRDSSIVPISKRHYQETKRRYMDFLLREEL